MKRNSDSGNDVCQHGSVCTDPRSKTEGAVTIKLPCSLLQPANFSSDFSAHARVVPVVYAQPIEPCFQQIHSFLFFHTLLSSCYETKKARLFITK